MQSISAMDISYLLRDFLEKFNLPQLVKIQEGHYDEYQSTTVGSDAVYNLLSIESIETVLLEGADGEESRIPLEYPCTVERVAEERFQQQQLGIQDLLHENYSAVKFVRVIQSDPNFETLMKTGDKLKIEMRKKKSRDNFLPFKNVNDKGKTLWKVPASCEAKFQPLWDGEELSLSKFVKKNKLPVYVRFIDKSTEDSNVEGEAKKKEKRIERTHSRPLPDGVVKLKGILVDSFVTATTEVNGVISAFSFPKTLPISVVPVKTEALKCKSPLCKLDSTTKEVAEDYEDMSGFQVKTWKPPLPKTAVRGNIESSDKTMTLAELEMGGQRVRSGNTYSPPPSVKVTRSKIMMDQRKGSDLLQRTVSNLELRTNPIESEENLYDDLNFSSLSTDKLKSTSLPRMQRRRSDSSADQVSTQNLNNLLHAQAQNPEDESFHGKVETVSLQIRRTSLTSNKSCTRMNTFGRKGRTAENESAPSDVNPCNAILESQSYSTNELPKASMPLATSAPFYSSEEIDLAKPYALNPSILLESQVRRSSGDALPTLPTLQESCSEEGPQLSNRHLSLGDKAESKGRSSPIGGKEQVLPIKPCRKGTLPETPRRSDNDTNLKQKSTLDSGISKKMSTNESDATNRGTEEDPPPLPLRNNQTEGSLRPVVPPKVISSGDNAVSFKERQPVPSPRGKSRSFHGQEQGERMVVCSSGGNAQRRKPRSSSTSSQEERKLPLRSKQGGRTTPGITDNIPLFGLQTKPIPPEELQSAHAETSETRFSIPQDLNTLRVPEVLQCLQALNMQQFEEIFKDRQVDGSMLVCLDEEALQSFGMDRFHRLKLLRVIAGWRPQL